MMYWNVCSHITYWLFPGSLTNLPRFIPFSSTPCPWISAHWFYIFISIRQGLKKIKSIKFQTNPFSCFKRKKVGNTWPETNKQPKNENYWSIWRLCVSLPWVWSRVYAHSGLFALQQYQHIHTCHLLHFLYAFTAVSIYFFHFLIHNWISGPFQFNRSLCQ